MISENPVGMDQQGLDLSRRDITGFSGIGKVSVISVISSVENFKINWEWFL
jgi:hypothetical protein